jgi:hypothetical protein
LVKNTGELRPKSNVALPAAGHDSHALSRRRNIIAIMATFETSGPRPGFFPARFTALAGKATMRA